jgi:hypothetical protein
MNYLVFVSVALVGSVTRRYGSALAARSMLSREDAQMTVTDQLGHGDCVSWLTRFGIQVDGRVVRYTGSDEALIRTLDGHMFRVPLDNPTVVRAECGPATPLTWASPVYQ